MLRWLNMPGKEDVLRPRKILRILRTTDQEYSTGQPSRGLDEKPLQRILPIFSVSPKVGKVAREALICVHSPVSLGIDTAIQGSNSPGSQTIPQLVQRLATRITQNQIEIPQPARSKIRDRSAGLNTLERHRRVQVIEHAHPRLGFEHALCRDDRVGAIRGHNGNIRVAEMPLHVRGRIVPFAEQPQLPMVPLNEISVGGVIRHVAFEKHDRVAPPGQCAAQTSP